MFFLLKKLRFTAITETSPKNYITYAFGEILLIVIGILIALQIDQFATDFNNDKQERIYISRLIEALDDDLASLAYQAEETQYRLDLATKLYRLITEDVNEFEKPLHILMSAQDIGRMWSIKFNTNTYEELTSTGNIQLIKSQQIVEMSKNYYKEIPYEWLDLYRKRLWDKYLPLAIEAIPLKMHLQILDQDRADAENELDIDEYEISISDSEVEVAIQKLKGLATYENQLKNIARTHKLHLYVMQDLHKQATSLKDSLADYSNTINN